MAILILFYLINCWQNKCISLTDFKYVLRKGKGNMLERILSFAASFDKEAQNEMAFGCRNGIILKSLHTLSLRSSSNKLLNYFSCRNILVHCGCCILMLRSTNVLLPTVFVLFSCLHSIIHEHSVSTEFCCSPVNTWEHTSLSSMILPCE